MAHPGATHLQLGMLTAHVDKGLWHHEAPVPIAADPATCLGRSRWLRTRDGPPHYEGSRAEPRSHQPHVYPRRGLGRVPRRSEVGSR